MSVSNPFSVTIGSPISAPSWASSLTVNAWTSLSNANLFTAVRLANVGQGDSTRVFKAWGSAALATGLGTHGSMIHWNGGHTDYYGNEVYRFDLSTLTWSRLSDQSPPPYSSTNWVNGLRDDGNPAVPHTYHYVGYRPTGNEFWTSRRETTNAGGGGTMQVSRFDLDTNTWTSHIGSNPAAPAYNTGTSCYDSSRDCIWQLKFSSGFDWAKWDFATASWTAYTTPTGNYSQGVACYVPTKDCVVFLLNDNSLEFGVDPASPNSNPVALTTSGTPPTTGQLANTGKLCWSSNLGTLVWYPNKSNVLFTLTPPSGDWRTDAWTWAQLSLTGTTTQDSQVVGTYGQFQIAEWGGVTVGILNTLHNGNCQAIRLQ